MVYYYRGNPEALLAERKRKLREAVAKREEANRWDDLTRIGGGLYNFATLDLSEND